jgi:ubiquinone biosynthesis protein
MSARRDRQRQIAEVMARHGMGFLVDVSGLARVVPFERGLLGHERRPEPYTQPEHLRLALEELGTTFIKLGQILSTRADLLPAGYQGELAKLQDSAPPVPADAVRAVLEQELDCNDAFADFDFEPLAAASIGQAHAAALPDGTEVVVKIRRPGVVDQVQQDLEILQNLAVRASRRWQAARGYDVVGLADEFAQTLRAELDYLQEGRNAERFAANFAQDPDVRIPRVFWEATTSRVLTLERIRGVKIDDVERLDAAGVERRALAERATRVTAKMVFEDGFFHADPHPGNFFIQSDGRIGIIDFGMVGTLDDRMRQRLGSLLIGLGHDDADHVTRALLNLGVSTGPVDRQALRSDVEGLLQRYSGRGVGEITLGPVIDEVLAIVRGHRLRLPRDLVLLLKMVVMEEGLAARLDPEFRLGSVLGPYARGLMAAQVSPRAVARRLEEAGIDLARLAGAMPDELRRLLDVLQTGGELEPLVARAERIGSRLVAGVLAAAFIDGLAEMVAADSARRRAWHRPFFAVGFGAAGTLAGYAARGTRRTPSQ